MKIYIIIAIFITNLFIAVYYYRMIVSKRIQPALAMWLFFSIAVSMSLITYLKEGNYSFLDNALNTADLFMVFFITLVILIFGDKKTRFNKFDVYCLVAVVAILIFWLISKNHWITNLTIQLIMVIAYFPVVKRIITNKKNTEPFIVWIAIMIAPLISLKTSEGALAFIYSIRAITCAAVLLILMVRVEVINHKFRLIRTSLFIKILDSYNFNQLKEQYII